MCKEGWWVGLGQEKGVEQKRGEGRGNEDFKKEES